jgi:hypothetical protein|tara:strand:+ start:85 stop:195 length:111 start_codon:yes stop_codon:yes gene_type:complete
MLIGAFGSIAQHTEKHKPDVRQEYTSDFHSDERGAS